MELSGEIEGRDVVQALIVTMSIGALGSIMNWHAIISMFFKTRVLANWICSFVFLTSFMCTLSLGRTGSISLMDPLVVFGLISPLLFLFHNYASSFLVSFTPQASEHTKFEAQRNSASKRNLVLGTLFAMLSIIASAMPRGENGSKLDSLTLPGALAFAAFLAIVYLLYIRRPKVDMNKIADSPLTFTDTQRAKSYPHPYPNGWYKLLDSNEIQAGEVKLVKCLGRSFAVFRSETDGKVGVLDAYCPHLGANLAIGGKVIGDTLQCPFHLWEFALDGKVTRIPYADKPPEIAKTKSWPVTEYHGQICIYFDAEGRAPHYELPRVKDIDNGSMVYHGSMSQVTKMHIQEFAENSVDYMHFQPLHGRMKLPWTDIYIPGLTIRHSAYWAHSETDPGHIAYFHDHAYLEFLGKALPKTSADATITFMGPGSMVSFEFNVPDLGRVLMFQTHTPLNAVTQHVTFSWYAETCIPSFMVSYVVGNWIAQWSNDLSIWENKTYHTRPLLVKGDGPVGKLRRWYSQFYSVGSPIEDESSTAAPKSDQPCTGTCEDNASW